MMNKTVKNDKVRYSDVTRCLKLCTNAETASILQAIMRLAVFAVETLHSYEVLYIA